MNSRKGGASGVGRASDEQRGPWFCLARAVLCCCSQRVKATIGSSSSSSVDAAAGDIRTAIKGGA